MTDETLLILKSHTNYIDAGYLRLHNTIVHLQPKNLKSYGKQLEAYEVADDLSFLFHIYIIQTSFLITISSRFSMFSCSNFMSSL